MYLGKIVEVASEDVIENQGYQHPYTKVLMDSILTLDSENRSAPLKKEIEPQSQTSSGCPFHPRCPKYEKEGSPKQCSSNPPPPLEEIAVGHQVACHFVK
jgi:oligopeptide/dipeptide ABC transporter ATP-binding protein